MVASDADIPIDIHCGKLLDWLISRRHCQKNWQTLALQAREKIAKAMQDMPEHPGIVEMLTGCHITYTHCLKIVDILKETEASSKNLFGRYSSQRMKDWREVCQLYEKDNVYLAELAQLLQQYVLYEIPALRKQVTRYQELEQECDRKETEYEKLIVDAEKRYQVERQRLHLPLDTSAKTSVRIELLTSAENLTEIFEEISKKMKSSLPSIIKYYGDFCRETKLVTDNLPALSFVIFKGGLTSTVYEFKHGAKPANVERVSLLKLIEEEEKESASDEINFDIGTDEINFEIEEVESGVGDASIKADGVARRDDALFLFENHSSMQALMKDLRQLQAFLRLRLAELHLEQSGQDVVGSLLSANVQDQPIEKVKESRRSSELSADLKAVDEFLMKLNDPHLKSLSKIRVLPNYLQTVADKVTESMRRADRYKQSVKLMREQQGENREKAKISQERAGILMTRSKELQKFIEADISKRYNNRPVHVTGSGGF